MGSCSHYYIPIGTIIRGTVIGAHSSLLISHLQIILVIRHNGGSSLQQRNVFQAQVQKISTVSKERSACMALSMMITIQSESGIDCLGLVYLFKFDPR